MESGGLRRYVHEHHFAPMDDGTRMRDEVQFTAPLGPVGELFARLLLKKFVMKMLIQQHMKIKRAAESAEWRTYLHAEADSMAVPERRTKVAKLQRFA
jgi:ligand-binding SRPBCC domain-containing protein